MKLPVLSFAEKTQVSLDGEVVGGNPFAIIVGARITRKKLLLRLEMDFVESSSHF